MGFKVSYFAYYFVKLTWRKPHSNLDLYYSQGSEPLTLVGPLNGTNDNTGEGQFHFGVFKMPTGADGIDVVHEGYQESDLDEGIIWGGVFIEDSAEGCVSLEP